MFDPKLTDPTYRNPYDKNEQPILHQLHRDTAAAQQWEAGNQTGNSAGSSVGGGFFVSIIVLVFAVLGSLGLAEIYLGRQYATAVLFAWMVVLAAGLSWGASRWFGRVVGLLVLGATGAGVGWLLLDHIRHM